MGQAHVLNVGVIGGGFIGTLHARVLHEMSMSRLVAIADTDEAVAKKAAEQFGCDSYARYEELLKRDDIDAVYICLPDRHHVEPAVAAARAGKHIFMEKPIARTVKEAEEIKSQAEKNNVRLMVGHLLRFDPRYAQLYQRIDRGELGEIIHMRVKRQNPKFIHERLKGRTSMLYYVGIHDIDVMLWCAREKATEVYAKKVSKVHDEDCVFALCTFESGAVATLEFSWSLPEKFPAGIWSEIEVVGTQGAASIDNCRQGLKVCTDRPILPDCYLWPEYNGRRMGDLRDESMHFCDAVLHEKEFLVPTDDAIAAVSFIEACFESMDKGKPVSL